MSFSPPQGDVPQLPQLVARIHSRLYHRVAQQGLILFVILFLDLDLVVYLDLVGQKRQVNYHCQLEKFDDRL
jgi:hypothetical protein